MNVYGCLGVLLLAGLIGCTRQPAVNVAEEEAAIRSTDAAWQAAVKARDLERTVSFWADDATIIPSNSSPITGKAAIRKYVADAYASPDFSIVWNMEKVVVSRAGDLAYATATDKITFRTPGGQLMSEKTNAVVIWKKQPDGSWKAVIDIWSAEPPPKPGTSATS
jgi:uncharacterized protein (TIGR02246 family)